MGLCMIQRFPLGGVFAVFYVLLSELPEMKGGLGFESFTGGRWKEAGVGERGSREGEQIEVIGSRREARVGGRRGHAIM